MPAKIVVLAGRDSNREIDIELPVVSIGGDPTCEILLSGEVATLATLRFRDGKFIIYNRTKSIFSVDGSDLAPDATVIWKSGKIVQFASGMQIRLECSGDPKPVRKAASLGAEDDQDITDDVAPLTGGAEPDPKAKAKSDQLTWALIVILLMMIWWAVPSEEGSKVSMNSQQEFQDLVAALLRPEVLEQVGDDAIGTPMQIRPELAELLSRTTQDERPILDTLRERLQNARIAELRGDGASALNHYRTIRDLLTSLGADRRILRGSTYKGSEDGAPIGDRTLYDVTYEYVVNEIRDHSN